MNTRTGQITAYESRESSKVMRLHRTLVQYTSPPVVLHVVYRADEAQLIVGPFRFVAPEQLRMLCRLPDDRMLEHCSTSPHVEPPRFCSELRTLYEFMLRPDLNPRIVFPKMRPILLTRQLMPTYAGMALAQQQEPRTYARGGEWHWFHADGTLAD